MEMTGRQRIEAPRDLVWAALNDPAILRKCIPGCQSLDLTGPNQMRAVAGVKVGPIGAKFTGDVTLSDLDPPNGYRIDGEGQGGAAGFAKGGARVTLAEDGPAATWLDYEVSAQVGGKLAQLGGALIDATAKQMAGQFFKKLAAVLAETPPAAAPAAPAMAAPAGDAPATATLPVVAAPLPVPPPPAAPIAAPATATGASALTWGIAALAAGLLGFVLGRQAAGWDSAGGWPGLAIGLAMVVVAGAGFAFGRSAR